MTNWGAIFMRLNIEFKTEREDKQMELVDKMKLNLQFFAEDNGDETGESKEKYARKQ